MRGEGGRCRSRVRRLSTRLLPHRFDQGGAHAMFGGQERGGAPEHIRDAVTRATLLFWRSTLRGDAAARAALGRFGSSLGEGDRFEAR